MDKIKISIIDLLTSIANAQDLVSARLSRHQQQVAYIAYRLAEQLGYSDEQKRDVFLAGLIHDIGALSTKEKLELIETEAINANSHGFRGAKLIEEFKPLRKAAGIIKYHHLPWDNGKGLEFNGERVPFESHIIHIADRTCAQIKSKDDVVNQLPDILHWIKDREGAVFAPELIEAHSKIAGKEYVWLDVISDCPVDMIYDIDLKSTLILEIDDIVDLAMVFSRIIDFRSPFTAWHSAGVAKTAEKLAQIAGFSPYECKMMLVAGYLHDLGKIAIRDDVLEKPAKLDTYEYNQLRAHTYYTYRLLEPMEQLKIINTWASFHHEKLNGKGYPFHISGDNLTIGSRIMAVADIFTAITEDRPYRKGMEPDMVERELNKMVKNNEIDGKVVKMLLENYEEIDSIRNRAQMEAARRYDDFVKSYGD